jgi:hypothetical protein
MATWVSVLLIAWVALSVVASIVVGGVIHLADLRRPRVPVSPAAEVHRMRRRVAEAPLRRVS